MIVPLRRARTIVTVGLAAATLVVAAAAAVVPAAAVPAAPAPAALPAVFPTPQQMTLHGAPVTVRQRAQVVLAAGVDDETGRVVAAALRAAGARDVVLTGSSAAMSPSAIAAAAARATTTVVVGPARDAAVRRALVAAGGAVPGSTRPEGYSLAGAAASGGGGTVVLAGWDADGIYHAAQTLRQLVRPGQLAAVTVQDFPTMGLRGSIEGFYGAPWSQTDRLDQVAFLGDVKANTYIYAPKDDVYSRAEWRTPYPAADLARLAELTAAATTHHVRLTYAVSPGASICYSDASDRAALLDKFEALYGIGVRSFYVALDDIDYTTWNCAADRAAYGAPGQAAAGRAQVDLLNAVQHDFVATHDGVRPLQMVPTEYSDTADSPYKTVLRQRLDPAVVIQWTGTDVVPPSISVADARAAATVWGRPTFLWDNYPVNDYDQTTGRLLLAPYDRREAGLHDELAGIVLNPMNQESPSKVAEFGGASFAWNDEGYDADRTWHAAASYLAGGDAVTAAALLRLFDVEHLAPTFGTLPWQPQAPALTATLNRVRDALATGSRAERRSAVSTLQATADALAVAPDQIRLGVRDPLFVPQTGPWLDALALWGQALQRTAAGLGAEVLGGSGAADFAAARALADRAAAVRTVPGTTRPQGTIKVADGVLDVFVADAPGLLG